MVGGQGLLDRAPAGAPGRCLSERGGKARVSSGLIGSNGSDRRGRQLDLVGSAMENSRWGRRVGGDVGIRVGIWTRFRPK